MITLQEVQDRGWHTSLDGYAYKELDDAMRADIYFIARDATRAYIIRPPK